MKLPDEVLARLFKLWPVGQLATLSPQGSPHIVPIVFCLHDHKLYSPIDGKPKSSNRLKRLTNVAEDPRAALMLDAYSADWSQLWWVRFDVHADSIYPIPALEDLLVARLVHKYPQYSSVSPHLADSPFLRLDIHDHQAWAAGGQDAIVSALVDLESRPAGVNHLPLSR